MSLNVIVSEECHFISTSWEELFIIHFWLITILTGDREREISKEFADRYTGLSSDPQEPYKKMGLVAYACNFCDGEDEETGTSVELIGYES